MFHKCCDVFGESSEGDLFNRLEKRIEMVNADAEGNVDIPGQARFPVKKNGLSADDHVRQVAFVQRCA